MSAGDFLIRRNDSETSTLPNAGSNLDATWDTEVIDEGSAATYSAGTFTLTNTAPYLIMYSEQFYTTDTTNNERIEGIGRIRMEGVDLVEGSSEGYIRKASSDQDMVLSSAVIYFATAGDQFVTRFYRGDNSATGTVTRVPDIGGVQIIELDPDDDFASYSTSSANTISSTEADVGNWTTDTQETGFSRSTNDVTITTAGRYLMLVSGTTSQTGTSRLGATIFLERGTTEVTGARGYSHMRGSDGNQNGALNFAAVVDVGASDTFTLRGDADSGSMTVDSGLTWQWWKLPSGNETTIVEATTGNMNVDTDFTWDTLPHIDTAAFTGTAGSTNIDVDQGCHLLTFWNQGKKVIDSLQRGSPRGQIALGGSVVNYTASSSYHRNSGSIGTFMAHSGSGILHTVPTGTSITLRNSALSSAGTLDVESGHWSLINLEGLYKNYTYAFPLSITDVDTDEAVTNSQTNVVIAGVTFEAVQGTGKVELVQNSNYTGTIISQSVDSWSDTSIQIDISAGALADTYCFLFVTNDSGSSSFIPLQVGLPPETYQEAIDAMSPAWEHYWTFQNTYVDEIGSATANNASVGTSFSTDVLVKGDSHSLLIDATTDYCSPADQGDMNTSSSAQRRLMGGWIMLDSVGQALSVIWEEGAQVNNYAFLNGYGNRAMWQFADDGGDYVQAYHDIALTPNRPYHVLMDFNGSSYKSGICGCYLDGVPQSLTNGNPWELGTFPSHSGNISWGHEGTENLQTGDSRGVDNVDIAFASPTSCRYAHWLSLQNNGYSDTVIRETLFEKGALADTTILSDTEANMQLDIDAEADTVYPDWPCGLDIQPCGDGDFELVFDNITFDERCSMNVRYSGADTLTIVLTNGSSIDESKIGTPYGGTVVVVDAVPISVVAKDFGTGLSVQNARVRIEAGSGGSETEGDVLLEGLTDSGGLLSGSLRYSIDQPFVGRIRSASGVTKHKTADVAGNITAEGLYLTVLLIED